MNTSMTQLYQNLKPTNQERIDLEEVEMQLEERDYRRNSDLGADFKQLRSMLAEFHKAAGELCQQLAR